MATIGSRRWQRSRLKRAAPPADDDSQPPLV